MPTTDFVPRSDNLFHPWQNHLVNRVNFYQSGWDLPARAATEWTLLTNTPGTKKKEWDLAWAKVSSGLFDKADTQRKKDARKSYESGNINNPQDTSLRFFINRYIRNNPLVTEEQKADMGLRVPDTIRTPSPGVGGAKVSPQVFGAIHRIYHLIHRSQVITPGATHKGLEKGVDAIEVYLAITDANVKTAPDAKEFSPDGEVKFGYYTREFDSELEDMRAWYKARKRYKGKIKTYGPFCVPWSAIIS